MDELPQPYRSVVKLLETEILDPAWLEITRLHPELLLDSEGLPLSLRPNYALKNVCTPSSVIEQTFLATSLMESQGYLIMTTSNDACVLADPATGALIQSLLLKSGDYSALGLAPTANPVKGSPLWIAALSSPVSNDRVIRVVICSIIELEEPLAPPEGDAGKKAPPKKGAVAEPEPMKKVGKCRLAVVEVRLGALGKLKNPSLIKMTLAFECFLSLSSASKEEVKSVDLSSDAELLAIATPGGVFFYSLPKILDRALEGLAGMENITEDAECEEEVEETKPVVLEPCLVLDSQSIFGGKAVKHVILSPLVSSYSYSSTVAATENSSAPQRMTKHPSHAASQTPFQRHFVIHVV